jgi:hypothetical protein
MAMIIDYVSPKIRYRSNKTFHHNTMYRTTELKNDSHRLFHLKRNSHFTLNHFKHQSTYSMPTLTACSLISM